MRWRKRIKRATRVSAGWQVKHNEFGVYNRSSFHGVNVLIVFLETASNCRPVISTGFHISSSTFSS